MKLLAIDGNSIVNRAFYGIKVLTTKTGQYTNGIYGFLNILQRLEKQVEPDGVVIAFDLKAPTFRHKMYRDYKGTRKGMPRELAEQMPILRELLPALGYKTVSAEGYEADDFLGTFSRICEEQGADCYIATGDRDSLQLVTDKTTVILATTGKSEFMNPEAVEEKYKLKVSQLVDLKALMGDSSDNIPGVKGIGEKTAVALLQNFATLDGVYENIDSDKIKKAMREKLIAGKDTAYLSKELGTICKTAPADPDLNLYKRGIGEPEKARKILTDLEMFAFAEKLVPAVNTEEEKRKLPKAEVKDYDGSLKKCVVMQDENGFALVWENRVQRLEYTDERLKKFLEGEEFEKIALDSKSIYRYCFENNIEPKNIIFDIQLAAYLENPLAGNYETDTVANDFGREQKFECDIPGAGFVQSCYEILSQKVENENQHRLLYDIEMPLAEVLAAMEYRGFAVDRQGIEEFGEKLREMIDKTREEIYVLVGEKFNLNSPKQLAHALFEVMGLPSGKKTKTGYSTNAETLENLRQYSPVIDMILNYRTYQKLNSTYVEGLIDKIKPDGRIHSTFNQTEARTGRISSSEPNLQNIPVRTKLGSEMRKFFVAKPGYVLLDADYSQIELRILAHISGDKVMQTAFLNGEDIHTRTAAQVMGIPTSMVTPQIRSRAKAVNFGIVYGISAFSLAKDIGTTVREAQDFIDNYFKNFSGVKDYLDNTVKFAQENGYVTTIYNRKRMLPEINSSNKNVRSVGKRMAMNTPIQGTSADIIKIAMVKVYNRLKAEGLKSKLILQVHDELIVEAPADEAERAAKILHEEMVNAAKLDIPLKADVNSGENWYMAKG